MKLKFNGIQCIMNFCFNDKEKAIIKEAYHIINKIPNHILNDIPGDTDSDTIRCGDTVVDFSVEEFDTVCDFFSMLIRHSGVDVSWAEDESLQYEIEI